MGKTQWVQHISGRGEKWRVTDNGEHETYWQIATPKECAVFWLFPKSEYHLCTPPERWEDVTERIVLQGNTHCWDPVEKMSWLALPSDQHGYRFRKVLLYEADFAATARYAFIVEKKVS